MKLSEDKHRKEVAINMPNNHEHSNYHTLKYLHADIYKTLSNNISFENHHIELMKIYFQVETFTFPCWVYYY